MSDVSGAQVLEAIGEATKDLRAKLATAQARIAELEAALGEIEAFPCDCGCVDCEAAISVAALALARKP